MADNSDEILRTYIENVLRIQQERDRNTLSDDELRQIALESGMTESDLANVRQRTEDCVDRGQGFIRYENWHDAIEELEQARALAPYDVNVLTLLATAYVGRGRERRDDADNDRARSIAERALLLDPKNDTALRIVSALRTEREELLGEKIRPAKPATTAPKLIILVAVIIALGGAGLAAFLVGGGSRNEIRLNTSPPTLPESPKPIAEPAPEKPAEPQPPPSETPSSLASPALTFGREGVGPGLMKDAREIAIGKGGEVYVAEYGDGRIQVFDSAGNYLRQWSIGDGRYVTGFAADRNGTVYIAHTGRIHRYNGESGESLGEVKYSGGPGFRDVAVMADGGLAASWDGHWKGGVLINPKSKDNLILFDKNLRVVKTIKNPISSVSGGVVFSPKVAVDGLGNIFMLGEMGGGVYHFKPDGKYVDRFGAKGDGKGELSWARGLAIDGRGRVFVTDFAGIHVFSSDGGYIGKIDLKGSADGLAFNDKDELYVVSRTKVTKFVVGA